MKPQGTHAFPHFVCAAFIAAAGAWSTNNDEA